jgi:hypothetical protein
VLINTVFLDLKDIRSDAREGLKTIPVVLGWDGTIRCLYLLSLISMAAVLGGILTGGMPGIALVLLVFTAYEFHYLGRAEALGESSMTYTNYVVADYEFMTWPLVVFAGLALFRCSGFFLPAALTMLIMAYVAKEWLAGGGVNGWCQPREPARRGSADPHWLSRSP